MTWMTSGTGTHYPRASSTWQQFIWPIADGHHLPCGSQACVGEGLAAGVATLPRRWQV